MRRALVALALAGCSPSKASAPPDAGAVVNTALDAGAVVNTALQNAPPPCPEPAPEPPPEDDKVDTTAHDDLSLVPTGFADLPGWADDRHAEALPSFLNSCAELAKLDDGDPIGV